MQRPRLIRCRPGGRRGGAAAEGQECLPFGVPRRLRVPSVARALRRSELVKTMVPLLKSWLA